MITKDVPEEASSRDVPPNSYPYPAGSVFFATSRTASIASPELYPWAGAAFTDMVLKRLNRLRVSGP